jgi:hypothetical protein
VQATEGNRQQAVTFLNGINPHGSTPTHAGLHKATHQYPYDLNAMFVLTDGIPTWGPNAGIILSEFPLWWEPYQSMQTKFYGIFVGNEPDGQDFMQSLVALAGGTFIHR